MHQAKHLFLLPVEPGAASEQPSEDAHSSSHVDKGAVIDRFTREAVVISAPSKVKGGPELQLPSMNALTNKTSSQAFFLRVLKVIIQLRDAALHAMKKSKLTSEAAAKKAKEDAERAALAATNAAAAAESTPATEPENESGTVFAPLHDISCSSFIVRCLLDSP